jgi:hypothetical protein
MLLPVIAMICISFFQLFGGCGLFYCVCGYVVERNPTGWPHTIRMGEPNCCGFTW